MQNKPLISIDKESCTHCYACVRACPTKAITTGSKSNDLVINHDRCIGCGNCYVSCGPKAIKYAQSIKEVSKYLAAKNKSIAIVDPSIASEFPDISDYRNFVGMFRALGFDYVNEISFGADLIAAKYKETFTDFKGKYIITANCPPVYEYIEKFQPNITDSIAKLDSPMIATAKVMREIHGDKAIIISISSCLAQKKEILRYNGLINEHIGFEELRTMFKTNNIYENSVEFSEFDQPIGSKGSLFPLSRGILDAADIDQTPGKSKIITREGPDNFVQNILDFANYNEIKHNLNIFYCYGCNMGPCSSHTSSYLLNHSQVINYYNKRQGLLDEETWNKNIKKYLKLDFTRNYTVDDQRIAPPSDKKIKEVLKLLGKDIYNDVGCKSCGYDNCYEFASDVAKDLVKPEMCISFTLKNRQEFINKLTATNIKLAETQKALEVSETKLRKDHANVQESMSLTKAILEKIPSGVVIVDDKLKIIQSNTQFIELIGKEAKEINEIIPGLINADIKTLLPHQIYQLFSFVIQKNDNVENKDIEFEDKLLNISVFPIKKGKIIGAVFKNLYQPEIRKEEVIARINDVIEKNLGMVQKIGFLLGEGASETERMLNSIIQSYDSNKNEEEK